MKLFWQSLIALIILIFIIWWGENYLIKDMFPDPQEENILHN